MTENEIGSYTGCSHGPNGETLHGCIDCAIEWNRQMESKCIAQARKHLNEIARLESERQARATNRGGKE